LAPVALTDSLSVRMARLFPGHIYKVSLATLLLPLPQRTGVAFEREKLGDNSLLEWVDQALESTTREDRT